MTAQLVYFELPVSDDARAREFFGALLGWSFDAWSEGYHTISGADPQGALAPSTGDRHPVVYFAVGDLDDALARVRELGGHADEPQSIPGVGRYAHCRDDQGTAFSLFEAAGA